MSYESWPVSERDRRPRLPPETGAWISADRLPFDAYAVGSLVPMVFERYARIFHPARAGHADDPDPSVRWDTVAAWSGRSMHALAQWAHLSTPIGDIDAPPPFVLPPDASGLPTRSLTVLCGVLAAHTASPLDACIGVWEGYSWPVESWAGPEVIDLENRVYYVRRGPVELALDIGWDAPPGHRVLEPPNILWPAERAWFVASDTDLDSTYVGGSVELVTDLLDNGELEVWEVDPTDSITFDSDAVNTD